MTKINTKTKTKTDNTIKNKGAIYII